MFLFVLLLSIYYLLQKVNVYYKFTNGKEMGNPGERLLMSYVRGEELTPGNVTMS